MIPVIRFLKPANLKEALEILSGNDPAIRPIAGGTDILPGFHQSAKRFMSITKLVDISGITELTQIEINKNRTSIGAATTFSSIANHPHIKKSFPLLAKAVSTIGSVQIRNRATIGGNFVNNAPCADSVPPLLVYDAEIELMSESDSRRMKLEAFLNKPYQTQIRPDELVTKIILPVLPAGFHGDFTKLGRRRGVAISRITLAILLKTEKRKCSELRIAAGAVTPVGMRFHDPEKFARGRELTSQFMKEFSHRLGKQISDATGLRWSTPYKLPVTQQLCYNLLHQIISKSEETGGGK